MSDTQRPDFDSLWNYGDPANTETAFREILDTYDAQDAYRTELLTQIARTYSLRAKFEEAHHLLDEVDTWLKAHADATKVRVRYLLERGRTFNSNKEKDKARPLFETSFELAQSAGLDFYTVDAAHMVAIATSGEEALEWNQRAMAIAENATDARARKWLGSLYNNIGWTLHDMDRFEDALLTFEKAVVFRQENGGGEPLLIAKWCVARTLRSLGRDTEALTIQEELLAARDGTNPTGYVFEELAWLNHKQGNQAEAKKYFALAYERLSKDTWLQKNEAERLETLKANAGGVDAH